LTIKNRNQSTNQTYNLLHKYVRALHTHLLPKLTIQYAIVKEHLSGSRGKGHGSSKSF